MGFWRVNTSNLSKRAEFSRFFGEKLEFTNFELREIAHPDPWLVMQHKVSQIEQDFVIVDDTSLEVEGGQFGTNIKWLLAELDKHLGAKAVFRVLIGYREKDKVHLFAGEVQGSIVHSRGNSNFGFNSMFLPAGTNQTLGEDLPDRYNARAIAVAKLLKGEGLTLPLLTDWQGDYQP